MDVKLPPYPDYHDEPTQIADAYRVALMGAAGGPCNRRFASNTGWRSVTSRVSLQMG